MFPIHDDNPTNSTAYVNYTLVILNILVFIYELSLTQPQLERFFQLYAVIPRELSANLVGVAVNQPVPEPLTLITSQFLHGGFAHIFGNMLFLWIFGNNIEDQLGHLKYIVFYLACGVLAALSQWFFSTGSALPSLGASGAIAGVLGAYVLRFPRARVRTLVFLGPFITFPAIPAFFFLGIWFLQQALYGVASLNVPSNIGMENGGVAYFAHIGGFVFGAILGPLLGLFASDRTRHS